MVRRTCFMALGLATLVGRSQLARAQNADSFYYSNEAALTAGATVAVPGDDGAAWTNPAGLASLRRIRVNVNGSVFGVRIRPIDGGLTSELGGLSSSVDYGASDFISTPTTASVSFSLLPSLTMNGGVFHTRHDIRSAVAVETVTGADGQKLTQKVDALIHERKLHAGGAYGLDLGNGFRFGSAMFLVYTVQDTALAYLVGVEDAAGTQELLSLDASGSTTAFGLQPNAGLQWDPSETAHLGIMFRFPELGFHTSNDLSVAQIVGSREGVAFTLEEQNQRSDRVRWTDPARLFVGFAFEPSARIRVALDADISFPLDEDTWGVAHRGTFHVRTGILIRAIDALHFGFGAFVDPASEEVLAVSLGAIRVDYYGGTTGVIWRNRLGADKDSPVVTTCAAIRYAAGVGEARTVIISDQGSGQGRDSILVHDVMPYLGSSVAF